MYYANKPFSSHTNSSTLTLLLLLCFVELLADSTKAPYYHGHTTANAWDTKNIKISNINFLSMFKAALGLYHQKTTKN